METEHIYTQRGKGLFIKQHINLIVCPQVGRLIADDNTTLLRSSHTT